MNGDFRSDKYLNRMEYYAYDLETDISTTIGGNNQEQMKNQHRFIIDNTAEINPIDWYNAFFEVEFKLVKLTDATDFDAADKCTMNNGLSLIKEIRVLSEGESVYNNNISANESANLLTLLNYTKSYADSVGSDQFFYVDTSAAAENARYTMRRVEHGRNDANNAYEARNFIDGVKPDYNEGFAKRKALTDGGLTQNISLPLNLYSYFASFKRNIHPNLKINIEIRLEQDANLILKNAAVTVNGKIIVSKLRLWCPKLIFNAEGLNLYRSDYMKPKKWPYLAEYFYKFTRAGDNIGDMVRLVTSIRKPRHVFIWTVPEASYAVQTANIFVFDTNSIANQNPTVYFSRAQLVVNNSKYYPELPINANEKTKLYRALMEYNGTYTQDKICGSLINRDNFDKLFGVLYFDLRKQDDDLIDASVTINFNYQLSRAPTNQYRINVLILHENEIELAQVGSKLLVRST